MIYLIKVYTLAIAFGVHLLLMCANRAPTAREVEPRCHGRRATALPTAWRATALPARRDEPRPAGSSDFRRRPPRPRAASGARRCVQSRVYTFVLPQLLLVRFEPEAQWTFRFQLLTMQLVSLTLLLCASLAMLLWPSPTLAAAYYDRLYALAILKHERRRGASAKSDDVIAMLEEETEALVSAHYQPPDTPTHDD